MPVIKSGSDSALGQTLFPKMEELVPRFRKEPQMLESHDGLSSQRAAAIFFALVAAVSAISTAIAPAIL
jgi:hypothetical protein